MSQSQSNLLLLSGSHIGHQSKDWVSCCLIIQHVIQVVVESLQCGDLQLIVLHQLESLHITIVKTTYLRKLSDVLETNVREVVLRNPVPYWLTNRAFGGHELFVSFVFLN